MSPFDPYHAWLGIEPREQPADYYRLLGLARFEADLEQIARAADERMALVRSYQVGPRGAFTQKLLNELSAARVCLLNAKDKSAYDAVLAAPMQSALRPPIVQAEAPPLQPPPVPPPIAKGGQETDADLPAAGQGASWGRPIMVAVAVALMLLAGVVSFGGIKSLWTQSSQPHPTPVAQPSAQPPPSPIVLMQEGSGEVTFSPPTATLSGGVELQVVGTEEVLAHWTEPEDRAQWRFRLVNPGFFQAELTYATTAEDGEVELLADEQRKTVALRPSGGLDQFQSDTVTLVIASGGEHQFVFRPLKQPGGEWLVLKTVRLLPVGSEKPPASAPP